MFRRAVKDIRGNAQVASKRDSGDRGSEARAVLRQLDLGRSVEQTKNRIIPFPEESFVGVS
jgi:hypothetical protein